MQPVSSTPSRDEQARESGSTSTSELAAALTSAGSVTLCGTPWTEMSDAGIKYKVRWQGYLGQDSWERGVNLAGARVAMEEFWIALEELMSDSEQKME